MGSTECYRIPYYLPFSVDTWDPASASKPQQFLSHAHADHLVGIEQFGKRICCTATTKSLLKIKYPSLNASFTVLEEDQPHLFQNPTSCDYTVVALPANHCPGKTPYPKA
jgi:Cft2 family RNA processing exonuclease